MSYRFEDKSMESGLISTGTLVMAVLFREGLVLGADKGSILTDLENADVGSLNDQDKLFKLVENTYLAASGALKVVNPQDYSDEWFNAITVTRRYFTERHFTNDDAFWTDLKGEIGQQFQNYLKERYEKRELFFELLFFFLDDENRIRHKQLKFNYDGQNAVNIEIEQLWFKGLYGAWGCRDIAYDLLKGESRLANLRKHSAVRPFMDRTNRPAHISLDQALLFIRKIMDASSQLLPTRGKVSREFDQHVLKGPCQFTELDQ